MADTAPDVYTEFVKALLDAEATRRTTLEDKGGAVISTSGTLVTLLFGLAPSSPAPAPLRCPAPRTAG
jgi:hypothetical protein